MAVEYDSRVGVVPTVEQGLADVVRSKSHAFVRSVAEGLVEPSDRERKKILKNMSREAVDLNHFSQMLRSSSTFGPEFVSDLRDATMTTMEVVFGNDKPQSTINSLVEDTICEWAGFDEEASKRRKIDYMTGKVIAVMAFADRKIMDSYRDRGLDAEHLFGGKGDVTTHYDDLEIRPEYILEQVASNAGFESTQRVLGSSLMYMMLSGFEDRKDRLQTDWRENRSLIIERIKGFSDPESLRAVIEARTNGKGLDLLL